MGFFTTASLKGSTTAAMAKTPSSRFVWSACRRYSFPPIQPSGQRQSCDCASSCDRSYSSLCHGDLLGEGSTLSPFREGRPFKIDHFVRQRTNLNSLELDRGAGVDD